MTRIESPSDPMFDEPTLVGVGENVRKNNNLAWRNVSVYDVDANAGDGAVSVFVRGVQWGWSRINLRFLDAGFQERLRTRFFERGGTVRLTVDNELMNRLKEAHLEEVEILDDRTLLIASPEARISGIPIHGEETFSLNLNLKVELDEEEETLLDVVQENAESGELEGGERFIVRGAWKGEFSNRPLEQDNVLVYPNPVDSELTVNYQVDADGSAVEISVRSVYGFQPKVGLFTGQRNQGPHHDRFNVQNLKPGLYVLTLKVGDRITTQMIQVE